MRTSELPEVVVCLGRRPTPGDYTRALTPHTFTKKQLDALRVHTRATDFTLSLEEICTAAKYDYTPGKGIASAPYSSGAKKIGQALGLNMKNLVLVRDDGVTRSHSTDPRIYWIYAIGGESRNRKGEAQWTLYSEFISALSTINIVASDRQPTGTRMPLWALRELGFQVSAAPRQRKQVPAEFSKAPRSAGGAGFGNAVSNKQVEEAAIAEVRKQYEDKKYRVESVERRRGIGYDLVCKKGRDTYHVEVKGIRGMDQQFFLTKSEKAAASKGGTWRIAVVRDALGARYVNEYDGPGLLDQFGFVESGYWLKKKDS